MPIHLPALSRRQFLRRTLAATASVVLAPRLFAEGKPVDADLWTFLSDTHLAGDRSRVERGINMAQHFEQASGDLVRMRSRPAGVFITGDCAFNSGQKEDYAILSELLVPIRRAGMPLHLALGNHDNRERFWEALQEEKAAKRPLEDRQVALIKTSRVNWFMLDSLETTLATPGLLGRPQLDWLASALDSNSTKPAIVMVHHNPGLSGNLGLKDTPAFYEVIRPRKQVKAYIYGHTHTWKVEQDNSGIHLVNLPPVSYVFQEGQPSGWVNAKLSDTGMRLELNCVDTTHKAHGQVVELKWRA